MLFPAKTASVVARQMPSMARSSPSVAFQAKGRQPLENIDQKVQTFAILSSKQRARRVLARGGVMAGAVAALGLLAFFGAQVEDVIQRSGVLQMAGLSKPENQPAVAAASDLPAPKPPEAAPPPAPVEPAAPAFKPGETLRDCESCPELVVLPGGEFQMGSAATEKPRFANEGPQHAVTIKPLAVSKYEVTFAEWDACLAASACGGFSPTDRGWGRGRRPAIRRCTPPIPASASTPRWGSSWQPSNRATASTTLLRKMACGGIRRGSC